MSLPVWGGDALRAGQKCGRGAAGGRAPWAGARLASVVLTMPSGLVALCFDANDPSRLAGFWAVALGWETSDETADVVELVPTDDTRFRIRFLDVPEEQAGQQQTH